MFIWYIIVTILLKARAEVLLGGREKKKKIKPLTLSKHGMTVNVLPPTMKTVCLLARWWHPNYRDNFNFITFNTVPLSMLHQTNTKYSQLHYMFTSSSIHKNCSELLLLSQNFVRMPHFLKCKMRFFFLFFLKFGA